MNLYHAMIELRDGAAALGFAAACDRWFGLLKSRGLIADWRLYRQKFGLASDRHADFLLLIEVEGMVALEAAFTALAGADPEDEAAYDHLHAMIRSVDIGLYRPYPDPAQRERIALI